MRNDHTSNPLGGRYPTPDDIERAVRAAHRLRAEAVHSYLKRAANGLARAVSWVQWPFRSDRIKVTVPRRVATC